MTASILRVTLRAFLRRHLLRQAQWLLPVCAVGMVMPIISMWLAASSSTLTWLVDLASHWQWLYLAGFILACVILVFEDRRWALSLLALPLPWLTAFDQAPRLAPSLITGAKVLTVASANIHLENADATPLIRWLEKEYPDVLVLHEVSPEYARGLNAVSIYPFKRLAARSDPFGMAILSRFPFSQVRIVSAGMGIKHIEAELDWNGWPVRIATWHPMPPITPHDHGMRNRRLRVLAEDAKASGQPAIIAGDLNATPWSNAFSGIGQTGFRRATGLVPTWPAAGGGWLGIPIDHVLVTSHWSVVDRKVGPNLGSDHLPVMVRIGLLEDGCCAGLP